MLQEISISHFRKFKKLTISDLRENTLIVGPNGYGKTSALWAIAIFLRGHNINYSRSSHHSKGQIKLSNKELAELLNYPPLSDIDSFKGMSHSTSGETGPDPIISAKIGDTEYSCKILMNGTLSISPTPLSETTEKLRYGFMGVEPTWGPAGRELAVHPNLPLSSGFACFRGRYMQLKEESKVTSE